MNLFRTLIIAVALLNSAALSYAMQTSETKEALVKLPSAAIIKERLNKMGLHQYLLKTKLDQDLGDTEKTPASVVLAVGLSLATYTKNINNPLITQLIENKKTAIVAAILQDSRGKAKL